MKNIASSSDSITHFLDLQKMAENLALRGVRRVDECIDYLHRFVHNGELPDIDWRLTYRRLNMEKEFCAAFRNAERPQSNAQLWIMPVVDTAIIKKVVAAYRKDRIRVDFSDSKINKNPDVAFSTHASRGEIACPYWVGFRRTIEPDEENDRKSAQVLIAQGEQGITAQERYLLGYGLYVTTGLHMDNDFNRRPHLVTICTGSQHSKERDAAPDVGFYSFDTSVRQRWGADADFPQGRSRTVMLYQPIERK